MKIETNSTHGKVSGSPRAGPFGIPARNGAELLIEAINNGSLPAPYNTKGIAGAQIDPTIVDEAGSTTKVVQDYRTLENAIGANLPRAGAPWRFLRANGYNAWLYRFGLERGYLDTLLVDYVVVPFVRAFRWCDMLERQWTDFLSGEASRESDQVKPHFGTIEEFT